MTPSQTMSIRKKTEPAAIVALVLAAVGIFTWGMSCIVALFLAPRAKRNITAEPEHRQGKQLALAAQIISVAWLLILVGFAFLLFKI